MANFDVSFLNPKLRKSSGQDYGFLVDQLTIKENQLASDGKLAPGDFDLLIGEAQKLYGHPGFTPDQRSNIQVKISSWQKGKKTTTLKDSQDIGRLNNEVKDGEIKNSMLLANNPKLFIKSSVALTKEKLNSLAESINSLQLSSDDYSAHMLEYENALNTYNDLLQVQDDINNYDGSKKPTSSFAAYVNTNSKGEITSVKIEKAGTKTGYAETNGLYGGLPIYGNAKVIQGKQVFKIGNDMFSATNILVPDPMNPGSFKNNKLINEASQTSIGGGRTRSTAGSYIDIDPTTLRSQTAVPVGSYVKGNKGFIYQAKEDGSYKKIVNTSSEKLGIDINDLPSIPMDYENTLITPRVSETVDGSIPTPLPTSINWDAPQQTQSSTSPQVTTPLVSGNPRTPSPTIRAPKDAAGIADSTKKSAGFFSRLFGF